MRLNPSLKTREPNRRSRSSMQLRLGEPSERRLATIELLLSRTRQLVTGRAEECRRHTLLEDNPSSG